ncbi:MAG: hypothetical protein ACM3Z4_20175 [Hyphomicrobiales bacterium]|jgi:hypothetical protein
MDFFTQIIAAIYVALGEAAGGPVALCKANQVLRDAIADGAVDDPTAIGVLESLSHDEEDTEETTEFERQPFSFLGAY